MKSTVLVISSVPYSISEGGNTNEGLSLTYVEEGDALDTPNKKGFDVMKESAPLAQKASIAAVPGYYEITWARKSATDGRGKKITKLVPEYLAFIRPADIFGLAAPVDSIEVGKRQPEPKAPVA